jgi:hypothetical protein
MHDRVEDSVINEELWLAWAERENRRDEATSRAMKLFGGITVGLMALLTAVYSVISKQSARLIAVLKIG